MTRPSLETSDEEISSSWRVRSDLMDVRFSDMPFTLEAFAARHFREVKAMYGEVRRHLRDSPPDFDEWCGIYENYFLRDDGNWALWHMIRRHEESDDLRENGESSAFCTLSTFLDVINDEAVEMLDLTDLYIMVPMERALDALLLEAFRAKRARRVISDALVHWMYRPGGRSFLKAQTRWESR